jgi:hypothetical protein
MIYNVVDHESNPSHYQLSTDIIVIYRRITSYKALQHWLTHLLHRLIWRKRTHIFIRVIVGHRRVKAPPSWQSSELA